MKCVNIKLWDIQGCFHYILNAPRTSKIYDKQDDFNFEIVNSPFPYGDFLAPLPMVCILRSFFFLRERVLMFMISTKETYF